MTAHYQRLLASVRALETADVASHEELTPIRPWERLSIQDTRIAHPLDAVPVTGEDLCARLLRQCLSLFGFDGGAVLLSDVDRQRVYLSAYLDLPPELLQIMASGSDPLGLLDHFFAQPALIDLAEHPAARYRTALSLFAFRQVLLVPVELSRNQPAIVLLVSRTAGDGPAEFSPQFLRDAQSQFQAGLNALALQTRLHRNLGRYRAVEEGLTLLGRSDNPQELLQTTCAQVRRIFKSTIVWIGLVELNDAGEAVCVVPRMVSGAPDALLSGLRRNLLAPMAPAALLTALQEATVVTMNTSASELLLPEVHDEAIANPAHPLHRIADLDAMPSTLAAPMSAGGSLVGVLVLHQDRSYRFDAEDHRVVRIFAQQAALAIRTQTLLDQTQARADALASSEGRYRAFVQQITDGMFRLSADGLLQEVSDFGVALLGAARSDLVGAPLLDRVAESDRASLSDAISRAAGGQSCELSVNVNHEAGSRVAIVRMGPLRHNDDIVGIIGVARDDTDRRALQGKVLMREKLASVGLLSAGVAHEIYNPLSFLVSNLQTLKEDLRGTVSGAAPRFDAAEHLEMLTECQDGTARIRTIVSNLRQFSLEGSDVEFQQVDLNQSVESATWMVYLRARLRTHIQLHLDPEVGTVECMPGQVVQSVAQLLSNAIKASLAVDRTAPEVLLQTVRDGDYVEIRVIDRGCGISPADLAHVADPFFTANGGDGAGVGLTIVLDTASHHGGTLRLRSAEEGGTAATLILPVRQDVALHRERALDLGLPQAPPPEAAT